MTGSDPWLDLSSIGRAGLCIRDRMHGTRCQRLYPSDALREASTEASYKAVEHEELRLTGREETCEWEGIWGEERTLLLPHGIGSTL
jgi:hypothetical protein